MIMEFGALYFESQIDNKLMPIMHHKPKKSIKGKDIKFGDRSCFHKLARVVYRGFRLFYVSAIFYMLPYWMPIILFHAEGGDPAREHH